MFLGVFGMGIFLSFLLKVGYGTDTSSFMNSSIAKRFGISLGLTMICTNIIFLIPQLIWGRKLIGIGTIANMTLIGYTSDFCTMLENRFIPEELFMMQPYRVLIFIVALALFIISAALYMNAGMGLAPFDSIPTMVSQYLPIPFALARMLWDFLVILIGLLADGSLSICTVILAFTIGPTVSYTGKLLKIN